MALPQVAIAENAADTTGFTLEQSSNSAIGVIDTEAQPSLGAQSEPNGGKTAATTTENDSHTPTVTSEEVQKLSSDAVEEAPEEVGEVHDEAEAPEEVETPHEEEELALQPGWYETESGTRRYRKDDGADATGWLLLDDFWYWLGSSGDMATGWAYVSNAWYWLDRADGRMASSRTECDGTWSEFSSSGAWQGYASGWDLRDSEWHWLETGKKASGWRYINDHWYYMDGTGDMVVGWAEVNGAAYHLSASGAMDTGWVLINGEWYWLAPSGARQLGWLYIDGAWYWADPDVSGACAHDRTTKIGNVYYAFRSSCAMYESSWAFVDNEWYLASGSGALRTGWQNVGGSWYWMDTESAKMAIGWIEPSGVRYHLSDSGAMDADIWIDEDDCSYYLNASGALSITVVNGSIILPDGATPADGLQKIGNVWFFITDGNVTTGSVIVDGVEHLFDEATGRAISGWHTDTDGNKRHYDEKGVRQIGWVLDRSWYYLDADGLITTGWQKLNGTWYYLDPVTGAMQTGWVWDGNAWYYCNSSGAWVPGPEQTPQTDLQRRVVESARTTPSPGGGLCAAWVSNVFDRAGLGDLDGNANDMFRNWCNQTDINNLRVGMIIAVPSHTHTYLGGIYGHICIYIGANTVMDNVGTVRTMSLTEWLNYYTTTYTPQWGWYGNLALE